VWLFKGGLCHAQKKFEGENSKSTAARARKSAAKISKTLGDNRKLKTSNGKVMTNTLPGNSRERRSKLRRNKTILRKRQSQEHYWSRR
jgi:translation initiation factor IF-1